MDKADFSRFFRDLNGYSADDFDRWLFRPGMIHGSVYKWWGDRGKRTVPHEGVDFCLFADARGAVHHLTGASLIPAFYAGTVVSIIPDFLGRTIIVETEGSEGKMLLFYGHLTPDKALGIGTPISGGSALGLVSPPKTASVGLLLHAHITVARVHDRVNYELLNWNSIGTTEPLSLLDPLEFIDGPWSIVD
jgi:hypothetical protein